MKNKPPVTPKHCPSGSALNGLLIEDAQHPCLSRTCISAFLE